MMRKFYVFVKVFCLTLFLFQALGVSAQDFFTFTYTGPDSLFVGEHCGAVLDWGHPETPTVAYDAPPGGVLISFNIWSISGGYDIGDTISGGEVVTVTYEALDNQGNFEFFTFTLPVVDTLAPVFLPGSFPPDLTLSCFSDLPDENLEAEDNCSAVDELEWEVFFEDTISQCQGGSSFRIFEVRDEFGNVSSYAQEITFELDTTAPVITLGPRDTTMYCEEFPGAVQQWIDDQLNRMEATDMPCDSVVFSVSADLIDSLEDLCGSREIAFFGKDPCGNSSVAYATLTLLDTIAPEVMRPAMDTVAGCMGGNGFTQFSQWIANRGGMEVEDNCELTWTTDPMTVELDEICNSAFPVTFTATDRCGESVSSVANFTLIDTSAAIFVQTPSNLISTCGNENYLDKSQNWLENLGGGELDDACSPDSLLDIRYELNGEMKDLGEVLDSIERAAEAGCRDSVLVGANYLDNVLVALQLKFIITDACGNVLSSEGRWLAIIDASEPMILTEARDTTIGCLDSLEVQQALYQWFDNRAGILAEDDCDEVVITPSIGRSEVWQEFLDQNATACAWTGTISIDFEVRDLCGQSTNTQNAVFSVIDTMAPLVTKGPENIFLDCSDSARDSLVLWLDELGFAEVEEECGALSLDSFVWSDNTGRSGNGIPNNGPYPDLSKLGCDYRLEANFYLSDACGNDTDFGASFEIQDVTAPGFVNVEDSIWVECGEEILLDASAVSDACFKSVELVFSDDTIRSSNPNDCAFYNFTIQRTYSATDSCGNTSMFDQVVLIQDITGPEFELPADTLLSCDLWNMDPELDEPSSVVDACGSLVFMNNRDSLAEAGCGFTIFRTWIAEDICGNQTEKIQRIEVIDTVPPVFVDVPRSGTFDCDGFTDVELLFSEYLDTLSSSFADACGEADAFIATPGSYDLTQPSTWPGSLPPDLSYDCGSYSSDTLFFTPLDYVLYDSCENADVHSFFFLVTDTMAPSVECSGDTFLYVDENECEVFYQLPDVSMDFGCASSFGELTVFVDGQGSFETFQPDTLAFNFAPGVYNIEYTALACSGNTAVCSFDLEVRDTIAPEFDCPGDSSQVLPTADCFLTLQLPTPKTPTDNCVLPDPLTYEYRVSGATTIAPSVWERGTAAPEVSLNGGTNFISFELTDALGNATSCTYEIELIDTVPPTASCRPALVRVNPSGILMTPIDPSLFNQNSEDNCAIDSMGTRPDEIDCSLAGRDTTIMFYVFDAYGNVDSCATTMRVETIILEPTFELDICQPDTLRLLAQPPPPANIYEYFWTGPNNFSSNQRNPILTGVGPQNSGTYELRIVGLGGCEALGTVTVNISDVIIPELTVNFPTQCEGESIRLQSNAYAGNVTYHWYEGLPPNGVLMESTPAPVYDFEPTVGSHDYYVVVETQVCLSAASVPVEVEVIIQPEAPVDEDFIVLCAGEDLRLSGENQGPGFTYNWTGPNGYFSSQASPPVISNVTQNEAGIYQFVTEIGDCVSPPSEVEVVVNSLPEVVQIQALDVICEGEDFFLNISSPIDGDVYRWFSPSQNTLTTQDPELELTNAGLDMNGVWRVEVEKAGCVSDSLGEVLVEVEPKVSLEIEQEGSLCQGDTLILSTPQLPNGQFEWQGPTGMYAGHRIRVPAVSGGYTVTFTSDNECVSTESINVNSIVAPEITAISNSGLNCIEQGTSVELMASVFPQDMGDYTYVWNGPNGFTDSSRVGVIPNANQSKNGWYNLTVYLNGCPSQRDSTELRVTQIPEQPVIMGEQKYCEGETIELSVSGPGMGTQSFLWLTSQGDTTTSDTTLRLEFADTSNQGYYSVRASVNDCRSSFSDSVFIDIVPLPDPPEIAGTLDLCEEDSLILRPIPLDSQLVFRWILPNGDTIVSSEILQGNVGMESAGIYRVRAEREGCSDDFSEAVEVIVKEKPSPPVIDSISEGICLLDDNIDVELCIDGASAINGASYQWYFADDFSTISDWSGGLCYNIRDTGLFDTGQNSFTARIDLDGCLSDFALPINVEATLPMDFDPMAGVGDTVCGDEIFIANALSPMSGSGRWIVSSGDVRLNDASNPQTEMSDFDFGSNVLIWSLSEGFCENYAGDTIELFYDNAPRVEDDFYATPYNERIRLPVLGNDDFEGKVSLSVSRSPLFGTVQNQVEELLYFPRNGYIGNDTLYYELCSDACPDLCSEAAVIIQVGDESLCDIPTIFTPNEDGINDFFVIQCLSCDDYPNNKVVIFNQNGSEVYYASPYENDWRGDYKGKDLPVGTYFYIVDFGDGQPPQRGFLVLER
jgi:gliding motility-associated-like protein